jgi:hypothetical protein
MRTFLFVILMLSAIKGLAQNSLGKKVTIELENISVEKALTILSISYGVEFSYSDDIVPTQKIITLSIQNEELLPALEKFLSPLAIGYKIVNNRILLKKSSAILTQTIRGKISEEITHAPVPGVTILVRYGGNQVGASSDTIGKFRVPNVPIGRVSIVVSCIGYDTRTIENILLGTGKELVLDLKIKESITAMSEVVVTAPRQGTIPGDGVALTSSKSFSVEDTKRYAGSMGDPARMVTAFPGVTATNDENNALIVRGNSPRGMLWRIEGIEVPNPNHFTTEGASGGIVSVLSPNMIEGSDFLTGAFPAQYGNALSGVFDMNLRSGNNERNEYSVQAGLLGVEASAEGPIAQALPSSYLVNYRYSTLSILDKLNFDLNDVGQYKDYQDIAFKINHPSSRAGTFSLFGIGGRSRSDKALNNIFDKTSSDIGILGLTYKNKMGENSSIQSALSFSTTQIGKDSEISEPNAGLIKVQEQYTKSFARASVSMKRKLSSRYVIEGGVVHSLLDFNFYLRNRDPGNTPYQVIINFQEQGNTSITQGFLFARQYFSSSLFGFYGFHLLRFAMTKDQSLEPRMGLRWQPSEKSAWSIAFGKHSKIENLQYYLARDHQAGGNEVQINKDLGFTRADHVVVSHEQTLFTNHKLKIEFYHQRIYNAPALLDPVSLYSSINEDTGFITDTLLNTGRGQNYGVEFSLEKSFTHSFYYLLNASLYESRFTITGHQQRNTSYNGNYTLHFLAGKEFPFSAGKHRLGINFKATASGGRPYVPIDSEKSSEQNGTVYNWERAFEQRLPDYFRTDFQVVYKKSNPRYAVEWRLDIQNFTDHRNASFYYFDASDNVVKLKKTIGFLPLLSCRFDF